MSVELVNSICNRCFDYVTLAIIKDPEILSNHPKPDGRKYFYSKNAIDQLFNYSRRAADVNPSFRGTTLVEGTLGRVSADNAMKMAMTIAWQIIITNHSDCFQTVVTDRVKVELRQEVQSIIEYMEELGKGMAEYIEQGNQLLKSYLQDPNSANLHPAEIALLEAIIPKEPCQDAASRNKRNLIKDNLAKMMDSESPSLGSVLKDLEEARINKEARVLEERRIRAEEEAREAKARAEAARLKAEQEAKEREEALKRQQEAEAARNQAEEAAIARLKSRLFGSR